MPRKILDLVNQRFGKLEVLHLIDSPGGAGVHRYWLCRCDCGREVSVMGTKLKAGYYKQCPTCSQGSKIEVGALYGYWKVLSYSRVVKTSLGNHYTLWNCLCTKCNRTKKEISSGSLNRGKSTQCPSCASTKHGLYGTRDYSRQKENEYREKKNLYDSEWTIEMQFSLYAYFSSCVLCGVTQEDHLSKFNQRLHIDHVLPLVLGYGLKPGNAVLLCGKCNRKKNRTHLDNLPQPTREKLVTAAENFRLYWETTSHI